MAKPAHEIRLIIQKFDDELHKLGIVPEKSSFSVHIRTEILEMKVILIYW